MQLRNNKSGGFDIMKYYVDASVSRSGNGKPEMKSWYIRAFTGNM